MRCVPISASRPCRPPLAYVVVGGCFSGSDPPADDARFAEATNLIARYPEHPLRTLDALHLTMAADLGVSILATADGVMADAAMSMGLQVVRF